MSPTIYADTAGRWRWRIRGRNGRIVACSGESFASKRNAQRALDRFLEMVREG